MTTNPVIIFGAGGLGKATLEIFQANDVLTYGFLDDNISLHKTEINDISVMGPTDDHGFLKYIGHKCDAFVAISDRKVRKSLFKMLNERRKVMPVNAVHPKAVISGNAYITYGLFANAGAVVGSFAKVGVGCLLHTNAVVDYEATLGEFVQIGAGSVVSAGAEIGDEVFIGAGAIIAGPVKIGKGARIGAGSVVINHVDEGQTVFGNPAKPIDAK